MRLALDSTTYNHSSLASKQYELDEHTAKVLVGQ